jgi:hypothetical protein
VTKFPVGTSCTYRVTSKCGYPTGIPNIRNKTIANDFSIAYATIENLDAADELNGWEFETTMDWTGAYQSSAANAYNLITDGATKPKVTDLNKCNLKTQNLYVVITRTQQSTQTPLAEGDDFLTETPRLLQGQLTPDFEIAFSLTAGNAKFLGAISFALAAVLAVFAF